MSGPNYNIKKITHIQMNKALFVPGLPEFKRTLSHQFYPGISMVFIEGGVDIEWQGVSFFLPHNMYEVVVYVNNYTKGNVE